jgi:hypothetical protein
MRLHNVIPVQERQLSVRLDPHLRYKTDKTEGQVSFSSVVTEHHRTSVLLERTALDPKSADTLRSRTKQQEMPETYLELCVLAEPVERGDGELELSRL